MLQKRAEQESRISLFHYFFEGAKLFGTIWMEIFNGIVHTRAKAFYRDRKIRDP